jgi:hypothetical protein
VVDHSWAGLVASLTDTCGITLIVLAIVSGLFTLTVYEDIKVTRMLVMALVNYRVARYTLSLTFLIRLQPLLFLLDGLLLVISSGMLIWSLFTASRTFYLIAGPLFFLCMTLQVVYTVLKIRLLSTGISSD